MYSNRALEDTMFAYQDMVLKIRNRITQHALMGCGDVPASITLNDRAQEYRNLASLLEMYEGEAKRAESELASKREAAYMRHA